MCSSSQLSRCRQLFLNTSLSHHSHTQHSTLTTEGGHGNSHLSEGGSSHLLKSKLYASVYLSLRESCESTSGHIDMVFLDLCIMTTSSCYAAYDYLSNWPSHSRLFITCVVPLAVTIHFTCVYYNSAECWLKLV